MLSVNGPSSRFHRSMHHLALIAMVLMLCMPVMSRWHQGMAHGGQAADASDMCLSSAVHAHQHPAGHDSPPKNQHNHDHDACGYCTLATRMLPVLAVVMSLQPPLHAPHAERRNLFAPPAARHWRAHSPRGPPPHL